MLLPSFDKSEKIDAGVQATGFPLEKYMGIVALPAEDVNLVAYNAVPAKFLVVNVSVKGLYNNLADFLVVVVSVVLLAFAENNTL